MESVRIGTVKLPNEAIPISGQSLKYIIESVTWPWTTLFWLPLAFAIVRFGAVQKPDLCLSLAAIAVISLLFHACQPDQQAIPLPSRPLRWTLLALPAYVLCQACMPISVVPSETMFQLFRLCGCVLLFLAAHYLTCRRPGRAWSLALPLIAVATAEAILGLQQTFSGPGGFAHGTYVHRNHFAGLLEMALPFAVVLAFRCAVLWPRLAGLALTSAGLILGAVACSLSRSGFAAAAGSLFLMALVAARKSRRQVRAIIGIAAAGALLSLIILLPPDQLIDRFRSSVDSGGSIADVRLEIWSDTAHLIAAYPIFGCGLGGFEMALNPFRTAALEVRMDYAHNDYLQALAELGAVGFAILAIMIAALVREIIRAVRHSTQPALALACAGALAALAAHSFTDFNLHIPANALVAAWIAGIASGLSAMTRKPI